MITKFNHVAIAVVNLKEAINLYKNILGGKVSEIYDYPNHGVSVSFVELENTKIELMQPLGDNSPINNFLEKNKNGGIHHICIEVNDIFKMRDKLLSKNMKILGDGEPKIGAHNKPVLFLHPKEFNGTLIELEQE
jgi:methylmalonyl-CoA/ethylmalonyl-CoA epimerase